MEVQIPIQIPQQLRDPKRILHKDSIIHIHFIKGCWYQNQISCLLGNPKSVFKIQIGMLANTLVEYVLQAWKKCEKTWKSAKNIKRTGMLVDDKINLEDWKVKQYTLMTGTKGNS